jgi:hypothetical protein
MKALQQLNAMQLKEPDVWLLTMYSNYLGLCQPPTCGHPWQLESGIHNVQELRYEQVFRV